jgi:hypothetical protein
MVVVVYFIVPVKESSQHSKLLDAPVNFPLCFVNLKSVFLRVYLLILLEQHLESFSIFSCVKVKAVSSSNRNLLY